MKINDLTYTEEMIMMVVWSLKSAYLKDIMNAHPYPKPHQNTVSTYLKILQEKKFISTKREGRIFKYEVEIYYEDYKSSLINQFLEKHFENSSLKLVEKLVSDQILNPEDLSKFFNAKKVIEPVEEIEIEQNSDIANFIKTITEPKKKKSKKKKKNKNKD